MLKLKTLVISILAVIGIIAAAGVVAAQEQSNACVTHGAVPAGNAGLAQDCETLLRIMDTLRGSATLNWSSTTPISSWTGVRLGGSPQRVTIMKLQKQNLDGQIPAGIGQLDKLIDLWLYVNDLSGPLPAELGNLADLKTLMLSNNDFSGQIPLELNNLNLDRLWLKGNSFTGCMPANLLEVPDGDAAGLNLPACTGGPPPPPSVTSTPPGTESLSEMVKRVRPAVVKVVNMGQDGPSGYGSGFIFRTDDDGAAYILTNYHVVDEAEEVWILVEDETFFQAAIEAVDPRRDLGLLRICCGEFTTVEFMDSSVLYPGDEVIAIGYAQDDILPRTFRPGRVIIPGEATVTRGIISAFRYYSLLDTEVVQHDAPNNPGNSGGPLLSLDGRVVGINTFGFRDHPALGVTGEGLNFAVLETTTQERLRLWDLGPSAEFGPLSGVLRHDPSDDFLEVFQPEFTATEDEFAIGATFTNPYAGSLQLWSYGFYFGRSGEANDQYLYFVVDSRKQWFVYMRDAGGELQRLHSGIVPQLRTGTGEKNALTLYVDGPWGELYVNGQRVRYPEPFGAAERVNLGGTLLESHGGEVAVMTGFFIGSERSGARTRYESFVGVTYDHGR